MKKFFLFLLCASSCYADGGLVSGTLSPVPGGGGSGGQITVAGANVTITTNVVGNTTNVTIAANAASGVFSNITSTLPLVTTPSGGNANTTLQSDVNAFGTNNGALILKSGVSLTNVTITGNGTGLTNLALTNVVANIPTNVYVRLVSPGQGTNGTYWGKSGEGLYAEASCDLSNWFNLFPGTNQVWRDPDGTGPHDPDLVWDSALNLWISIYTKQTTNFGYLTNVVGIISSSNLLNWSLFGTGKITVTNDGGSASVVEAPQVFIDTDGSRHLTVGIGAGVGAVTKIYEYDLNSSYTVTAGPVLVATNTGYGIGALNGLEDSFLRKSNATYYLYVNNQVTRNYDIYTNSVLNTLFTVAKTNILNNGLCNGGCLLSNTDGRMYFWGADESGVSITGGRGVIFGPSVDPSSFSPVASTKQGSFIGEYPLGEYAFNQGTVCIAPTNQIAQLLTFIGMHTLSGNRPELWGSWRFSQTNSGILSVNDPFYGMSDAFTTSQQVLFQLSPEGAPSARAFMYMRQSFAPSLGILNENITGQFGSSFGLKSGGGKQWELISGGSGDPSLGAGTFAIYDRTDSALNFSFSTSGTTNYIRSTITNTDATQQIPLLILGKTNDYYGPFIQNGNNGTNASTDVIIGNDKATSTSTNYYVDLGINSSTFNGNVGGFNDGYLYAASGLSNMYVGAVDTNGHVRIVVAGQTTNNTVADFGSNVITFQAPLTVNSNVTAYQYISKQSNLGGATAIDWSKFQTYFTNLASSVTFTFANNVDGHTLNVSITGDASHTVTWPGTVKWPGTTAPTQTLSKTDIYTFIQINGNIYGSSITNFP